MDKLTPVIAIVGRTNVGKSTLFNRLIGVKKAIVSREAGTTRDINFGHCHWRDQVITMIDTAGLDLTSAKSVEEDLKRQADHAMTKADLVAFVVDVGAGVMPQDRAMAKYLQRSKKPVLLLANKSDNPAKRRLAQATEWLSFGFGEPHPVSAANGSGVGDFLDVAVEQLKALGATSRELPPVDARVAIVGKPNVGKSSLLNALAGEPRVIVSEVPHTTKEPQDTLIRYELPGAAGAAKHILLVDTVGIRKKARVERGIESMGVKMSIDELERADTAFLVIDATEGVGVQERKLAGLIEEKAVGIVVIVNKWDLSDEKNLGSADDFKRYLASEFRFMEWAPVVFIAAKTGYHVAKLLSHALEVAAQRQRRISDEDMSVFAEKLKKIHHSAFRRGEKRPHVYGLTQTDVTPPTFTLVVKDKETIHPNFLRFVENRIRDEYGFAGTPLLVQAREIGGM
ncbi:ribosome biogenesis GTPase Der [Candidatus Uhrbacteria bacterium]|nr:ribosome biogenesis GTPase Der [Candidatus Uhrbacteria bacterium]